jgi:hypothetical protein
LNSPFRKVRAFSCGGPKKPCTEYTK